MVDSASLNSRGSKSARVDKTCAALIHKVPKRSSEVRKRCTWAVVSDFFANLSISSCKRNIGMCNKVLTARSAEGSCDGVMGMSGRSAGEIRLAGSCFFVSIFSYGASFVGSVTYPNLVDLLGLFK